MKKRLVLFIVALIEDWEKHDTDWSKRGFGFLTMLFGTFFVMGAVGLNCYYLYANKEMSSLLLAFLSTVIAIFFYMCRKNAMAAKKRDNYGRIFMRDRILS